MSDARATTVAMLLSCDSFESFFGDVLRLDRARYLADYRNDWSWYYARGLADNGLRPILYLPSLNERGLYETTDGIDVRFLPLPKWYRPIAKARRAFRATRWSLYAQERVNSAALLSPLRTALAEDGAGLLYCQEYWGGRFDHLVHRVDLPVTAQDHGGVAAGTVKWFKRAAFAKAQTCYGQTDGECRLIEQHGGRAALQPNGCDLAQFCPDPTVTRAKTILTVARLTDKQKRTSDLIRAMTKLCDDWTLDIVGTGPDQATLEALAVELGVADRVRFQGFQSRAGVRDFLRRCGVYAMPSSNEAVCIALLEAMGCGASVVCTKIRAFEPLIEDGVNGRIVGVGDVDALAAGIEDAWQFRSTRGAAATDTVAERYDTRVLYRRLAESLRASARVGAEPAAELVGALA